MPTSPWEDEKFARLSLANMDQRFLPGTAQEVDFLEGELRLTPPAGIVDLGCGAGRHAIELARRGYHVTAADISALMLAEARRRAQVAGVEARFLQADLAQPLDQLGPDASFEAALCLCESGLCVLGGETGDLRFLAGVRRLLVPGGRFTFTTYNALRKYHSPGPAFDPIRGIVHWQHGAFRQDQRVYTPSELRLLLLWAGFRDAEVLGCFPGHFCRRPLEVDDIEMMLIAEK